MKTSVDDLKKVAEELNETINPDPKIKVGSRSTVAELTEAIIATAAVLEDGDILTQKTIDILVGLEVDMPAKIKVKTVDKKTSKPKEEKTKEKKNEKVETSKFGFKAGTVHAFLDDIFADGGRTEYGIVAAIMRTFPDKYPDSKELKEDSIRRAKGIIKQHIKDLAKGVHTDGKAVVVKIDDKGVISI